MSGEPVDGNPDFSTGDGAGEGALQFRPKHYVPVRVPVLDEFATVSLQNDLRYAQQDGLTELTRDDIPPVYRWPWRPEMQFTVSEFEKPALRFPGNLTEEQLAQAELDGELQTIDLTETQSLDFLTQLDLVDFIYSLNQNDNDPLDPIGG